jgi:hypothetical protein
VVCGCCGGAFSQLGKDYLGCSRARNAGACRNTARLRRSALERQVLAALGSSLMRPEMVAVFCDAFIAEWNRMAAEMSSGARAHADELKAVERKIANLVEAIEDGLADPGVRQRLADLRARQRVLLDQEGKATPAPPALHPNLAQVYAKRVTALREALDAGDGAEVLEAARALIETVVVSPPDDPGDPPCIELTGNLMAMLRAGGVNTAAGGATFGSCLSAMLAGSTKGELGEKFPSPPARDQPPGSIVVIVVVIIVAVAEPARTVVRRNGPAPPRRALPPGLVAHPAAAAPLVLHLEALHHRAAAVRAVRRRIRGLAPGIGRERREPEGEQAGHGGAADMAHGEGLPVCWPTRCGPRGTSLGRNKGETGAV